MSGSTFVQRTICIFTKLTANRFAHRSRHEEILMTPFTSLAPIPIDSSAGFGVRVVEPHFSISTAVPSVRTNIAIC